MIPATFTFHNPVSDINGFLKNIGLICGLLMVINTGTGALNIDSMTTKKESGEETEKSNLIV